MRRLVFNNDKRIGRVLFIIEGIKDEMYILQKIFTTIFNYQYEKLDRLDRYKPYNLGENPLSSIFVINTRESNIKDIKDANGYLDELFEKLINDYKFPVDKATIFYIFDRDNKSNTDTKIFEELINCLKNSREPDDDTYMQGLLLLSYPSIESFTASNYLCNTFDIEKDTEDELKVYLHSYPKYTNQRINKDTIELAVNELCNAISKIGIQEYDLDDFSNTNMKIFRYEENNYQTNKRYNLLSLLYISLLDLQLIEVKD